MSGITVVFDFNRFFTVLDGNGRERVRAARQRSKEQEDLSSVERQREGLPSKETVNSSREDSSSESRSQQSRETSWDQQENREKDQEGSREWYKWAWTQNSETNNAESEDHRSPPQSKSFMTSQPWDSLFVARDDFIIDWRKWLQERGLFPPDQTRNFPEDQSIEQDFGTGKLAEEARKDAAEVAAILAELRYELEAIDSAARSSPEALLRHVYSRHPPRNRGAAASSAPPPAGCPPAALRRCLLGAIRAYHEDKNRAAEHGRKWHLLCREITKHLIEQLELCD